MKPDRDTAEAILKLLPYPAFQKFVEAIRQDGVEAMAALVTAKPEFVGRLQGRAELAIEIGDALNNAAGILEKFQKNQPLGENGENRSTRIDQARRGAI
jgi:hypothetical protein